MRIFSELLEVSKHSDNFRNCMNIQSILGVVRIFLLLQKLSELYLQLEQFRDFTEHLENNMN